MEKKRKVVHSYGRLCELYLAQQDEIKELQTKINKFYNLSQQRKKEIEELKELIEYIEKKYKDTKIINSMLFDKIYKGEWIEC